MNLRWINSAGGPLVCASPALAKSWRGAQESSIGEERSDYERACDQFDYIDTIACGSAMVLVLGDEPLQSSFLVKDEDVLIVRWVYCESDICANSVLAEIPLLLPNLEQPKKFCLDDQELVMFDAVMDTIDIAACVNVSLKPGVFSVTTEMYKSAEEYAFLVHRLLRDQE